MSRIKIYKKGEKVPVPDWLSFLKYDQQRKYKMWLDNPRCCYCGIVTEYSEKQNGRIADNFPTIEHKYPLTDIRRYTKGGSKHIMICCNKCNNELGSPLGALNNRPTLIRGILSALIKGQYRIENLEIIIDNQNTKQ